MTRRWLHGGLSLKTKFVLPITVVVMASMILLGGWLIQRQADGYQRELESNGSTLMKLLSLNAESGVLFESSYELDALLGTLHHFGTVEYCIITNVDGHVLSHLGQNRIPGDSIVSLRHDVRASLDVESGYFWTDDDRKLYVLISPITTQKKVLQRETLGMTGDLDQSLNAATAEETIGWIEIGISAETVDQATAEATKAAILLTILVLLLTIIVVVLTVSAITKPITGLVEATDQISRGDFSTVVDINQSDEIGQLASTFNRMTQSLKQSREEIEQYNRTLEEKIIERTQQLEDAQAQLIQSEKLSAIGQLAAGVAHELNNPLGGILGYAQFTLEKLRKNVPEKTSAKEIKSYLRYVGDIELQARRCKTIVQNLLRFSRSSRTVEFHDVDINQAIEETLSFVEHQLRISQIELETSLGTDLPTIEGNAGQLQQVFTNLIINAMHASQPHSTVLISSRYCPALGEFGGTVELRVSDTGHGIAREDLKKIFEPFFTTKEVGKGTGLGLSVSYGIIKEHGGEITVESEVGRGTTFTITLPVQKVGSLADTRKEAEGNI
jgi:two-component system NtrC family sensor kinase